MELRITERGRELVASPEFAAAVIKFMRDWDGPHEEGAETVCQIICLTLCEVDYEHGPGLNSPEFQRFIDEHQHEIEAAVASTGCLEMLGSNVISHFLARNVNRSLTSSISSLITACKRAFNSCSFRGSVSEESFSHSTPTSSCVPVE